VSQTEALKGRRTTIPQIAVRIYREDGVGAFWRGNGSNVIRTIPNKGILFFANDFFIRAFGGGPGVKLPEWKNLAAGSLAGICAVLATYPLDLTCGKQLSAVSRRSALRLLRRGRRGTD
jgi:solute carrier family 25 (mitochondrial phosphate transporter), member 23/24/25/41